MNVYVFILIYAVSKSLKLILKKASYTGLHFSLSLARSLDTATQAHAI